MTSMSKGRRRPCRASSLTQAIGARVSARRAALRLQRLQLAGGKVMDVPALLNGRGEWFRPGTVLGGATV